MASATASGEVGQRTVHSRFVSSLATVFGLFSIVYGVSAVFASFEERRRRTDPSRSEPVSV